MRAFWQAACGAFALLVFPEEATAATPSMEPAVAEAASLPAPAEIAQSSPTSSPAEPLPHYGLGADFGLSGIFPDGGLLLTARPRRWARVQAGGAYNGFAFGIRAGATLVNPLVVPLSATCEGGHFFEGDANKAVRWFRSDAQEIPSLRRFSYDYFNLLGGLDFQWRHVSFYLRGGLTWMWTTVKDFQQSVRDGAQIDLQASDPKVSYRGPTLKLGITYFF
jgi:hypothetical protein